MMPQTLFMIQTNYFQEKNLHKMIKAIIFDIDGVVIKENYFSARYSRDFNIPLEKIMAYFRNEHQECIVGKADFKTSIKKYLKDWAWEKPLDELLEYWFSGEAEMDQELLTEINKLKSQGIKVYLATNQVKERTEYLEKMLGLSKIFAKTYSSHSLGQKKPHRDFFQLILDDLKPINASEILYFDNEEEKFSGARKLGIKTELYTNLKKFRQTIKKYFVS